MAEHKCLLHVIVDDILFSQSGGWGDQVYLWFLKQMFYDMNLEA